MKLYSVVFFLKFNVKLRVAFLFFAFSIFSCSKTVIFQICCHIIGNAIHFDPAKSLFVESFPTTLTFRLNLSLVYETTQG